MTAACTGSLSTSIKISISIWISRRWPKSRTFLPTISIDCSPPGWANGISHDDPNVTAPEQCRYDAGCETAANATVTGEAHRTVIPGGKYAALTFKGTVAEFEGAWLALLREWLPSSGLQLDGRPMFEYYPEDSTYDPATGFLTCKLCVPVMPL